MKKIMDKLSKIAIYTGLALTLSISLTGCEREEKREIQKNNAESIQMFNKITSKIDNEILNGLNNNLSYDKIVKPILINNKLKEQQFYKIIIPELKDYTKIEEGKTSFDFKRYENNMNIRTELIKRKYSFKNDSINNKDFDKIIKISIINTKINDFSEFQYYEKSIIDNVYFVSSLYLTKKLDLNNLNLNEEYKIFNKNLKTINENFEDYTASNLYYNYKDKNSIIDRLNNKINEISENEEHKNIVIEYKKYLKNYREIFSKINMKINIEKDIENKDENYVYENNNMNM